MKRHTLFHKSIVFISSVILLWNLSACNNDDKNVDRFKEAAMNLDNTSNTMPTEYDYWPECGIRITGSHLASLISLPELEKMLPCPLYVSGPHHDGQWDLHNASDFGHYNPEAIQYLNKLARKVVSDETFVKMSKPLVDKYLSDKMHIMMVLHDALYDKGLPDRAQVDGTVAQVRDEILGEIFNNQGYCYDVSCFFQETLYLQDPSWQYNGSTEHFLYFWARRWKDGTMDQFYEGLSTVYKAYHPEYNYVAEEYYYEPEEMMWDYEGEYDEEYDGEQPCLGTSYNCDLGSGAPIADKERFKEKEAVKMLREATEKLDKTTLVLEDEFDYWPECGIRITGGHLFSLISLRTLNRMLPCDLYLSGPHTVNHWELNCESDFGYYNPEAVTYLGKLAKKVVSDKKFVDRTRSLVDNYLKRQMYIMKQLYEGLNDPDICPDKDAVLRETVSLQGHIAFGEVAPEFMDKMGDIEDGSYVFSNTGEMFLYFWARRYIDGTLEQFHDILETVYSAYYPD